MTHHDSRWVTYAITYWCGHASKPRHVTLVAVGHVVRWTDGQWSADTSLGYMVACPCGHLVTLQRPHSTVTSIPIVCVFYKPTHVYRHTIVRMHYCIDSVRRISDVDERIREIMRCLLYFLMKRIFLIIFLF